ncbi:MAG: hypothetical protein ACKOEX_03295 [Planctomycetia bacterium]
MSDYYAAAEDVLPLFRRPAPSVCASLTSAAAADSLGPATLNRLHRLVLEFIAAHPDGVTDEEIIAGTGLNPSTARPRRIELARRGLVIEGGTRRSTSGRMATVWQATAASR